MGRSVRVHALEPVEVGAGVELGALDLVEDILGDGFGAGCRAVHSAFADAGGGGSFGRKADVLTRRAATSGATCTTAPLSPKLFPLRQMFRHLGWRQLRPHQVLVDLP